MRQVEIRIFFRKCCNVCFVTFISNNPYRMHMPFQSAHGHWPLHHRSGIRRRNYTFHNRFPPEYDWQYNCADHFGISDTQAFLFSISLIRSRSSSTGMFLNPSICPLLNSSTVLYCIQEKHYRFNTRKSKKNSRYIYSNCSSTFEVHEALTLLFPAHLYSDCSISLKLLSVCLSDSLDYPPEKAVIIDIY